MKPIYIAILFNCFSEAFLLINRVLYKCVLNYNGDLYFTYTCRHRNVEAIYIHAKGCSGCLIGSTNKRQLINNVIAVVSGKTVACIIQNIAITCHLLVSKMNRVVLLKLWYHVSMFTKETTSEMLCELKEHPLSGCAGQLIRSCCYLLPRNWGWGGGRRILIYEVCLDERDPLSDEGY